MDDTASVQILCKIITQAPKCTFHIFYHPLFPGFSILFDCLDSTENVLLSSLLDFLKKNSRWAPRLERIMNRFPSVRVPDCSFYVFKCILFTIIKYKFIIDCEKIYDVLGGFRLFLSNSSLSLQTSERTNKRMNDRNEWMNEWMEEKKRKIAKWQSFTAIIATIKASHCATANIYISLHRATITFLTHGKLIR